MINEKALAESLWRIDKINKEYIKFINKTKKMMNSYKENKTSQKLNELKFLEIEYQDLLYKDPLLPIEFLPINWQGFTARTRNFSKNK